MRTAVTETGRPTGATMDFLSADPQFSSLSLQDLLRARDQFHAHLLHKANVVGTAVGRS